MQQIKKFQLSLSNLSIKPKLTVAEKIMFSHLAEPLLEYPTRGQTYLKLKPDRVAMQDASAQTALLQFMQTKMIDTHVPSSVHCDQ